MGQMALPVTGVPTTTIILRTTVLERLRPVDGAEHKQEKDNEVEVVGRMDGAEPVGAVSVEDEEVPPVVAHQFPPSLRRHRRYVK